MIQACPNCKSDATKGRGSIDVESFRHEGKRYVEITCINCGRLWTPRTMHQIVDFALDTRGEGRAKYVQAWLEAAVLKEHRGGKLVI